ncbi:MAG: S8 family peptidase [Myxococcaceae bacterium]|nr:S8 family peptidase [Myxococcaceae bacterium]
MRPTLPVVAALSTLFLLAGCQRETAEAVALASLERPDIDEAAQPDDVAFHVPEVVVVDFLDGTTKAEFDAIEQEWGLDLELAGEEEGVDSAITVGTFQGDVDALLARIRTNAKVEAAEPLMRFSRSFVPNDPAYGKQWNLKMINMPKAWDRSKGKGVVVAVLDTGVAFEDHDDFRQVPDLKGTKFVEGYDFVNKDRHANDDHGHGTHVAGTIAQATNNAEGVAGVAFEAAIMPVKVLDHFGGGTSADIADAIRWAADHGANVINMSLGGGGRSAVMEKAVDYARKKGVVVVCAAGNGGRGIVEYPAAYPGSVAVAAVGPGGQRAPYSSWGKELDVAAPGGDKRQGEEAGIIQNTIDPEDVSQAVYASYQGTSMATPHVAGVAALLFAAGAKNPDQVEKALFASAHPPKGATGWTDQYGHGVIDAEAALQALKKLQGASDVSELLPTEVQVAQAEPELEASDISAFAYGALDWKPFAFAAAMLAFVLLTLGRKERPGYLNVFASPGFLIPLALTTMGVFFVRWVAPAGELSTSFTLPIPDWLNKIIFGRGSLANPLVYSALVPTVLSLIAIKVKGMRQAVGGVALGFAGILAYTVWAKAPALSWLPFTFLAIPWLAVNALICLFVARAMLKRETA